MNILAPCGGRKPISPPFIATDTEFEGPHTLTVQDAARVAPDTIAVQVYRSEAVPALPADFDVSRYLPTTQGAYGRFCKRIELRPVKLLTPDLSPARMLADLYQVRGLNIIPRHAAWHLLDQLAPQAVVGAAPFAANVSPKKKFPYWDIPRVEITLVGHFLRADFGRIYGQKLWQDLRAPHPSDPGRVRVRARKVIEFVEGSGRWAWRGPVLEYACLGDEFYAVAVNCRDTILPFGHASLEGHSQTFLKLGKSGCLSEEEKRHMLQTFRARTADAYGYAMTDAVNTLLVYEEMEKKDAELYRAFGLAGAERGLRPTLGSRVSTFLLRTTQWELGGSTEVPSQRGLEALWQKGSVHLFKERLDASRYGVQTGQTHGGLLYSRSPTRFWHEAPGMLRDVDMAGCYNAIVSRIGVYCGRPVVLEPGGRTMTLKEAVEFVGEHAPGDAWVIRASGPVTSAPNALLPSTEDALTALNYREQLSKGGRRRRARRRALHLEALRDPDSVEGTGGSRLYSSVVESGVVTAATWLMIRALPETLRRDYENLAADSLILYPSRLVAETGWQYDELVARYRTDALPWEEELDLDRMELVKRLKIDAEYVSFRYPIGAYAEAVRRFRAEARKTHGEKSGLDLAWKQHANTMYGVLASAHLPTGNFVAANQVTAWARAEAFALGQALNAVQTITDGCTYRLDQVPTCTFAECLRIKPDYPIRRAEAGDGIPFLDPRTIPQDDAGFTAWYYEQALRFYGVSGEDHKGLFGTHDLAHKKTGKTGSVAFDALACDGAANYVKCTRDPTGAWTPHDFAARSFRESSKAAILPWLVGAYSTDHLTALAPLAEDTELLSFHKAGQRARKALAAGIPEVVFPLGLDLRKVQNYRALKASALVFATPEQRIKLLKQWQKFEEQTGCGLELLTLRRSYRGRTQGSLAALAEDIYQAVRAGCTNLNSVLNLSRLGEALNELAAARVAEIERLRAKAEDDLFRAIDVRNLDPATLPTAWVVTAEDVRDVGLEQEEA